MHTYSFLVFFLALALEAQDEKIYSQKEFDESVKKKVEEGIRKKMDKIRPENIMNFSRQLIKKEKSLQNRSSVLSKKEEHLMFMSKELEEKISDFEAKQKTLIACIEKLDHEKNNRIKHMVNVISGMRPKHAADMLSIQEATLAVKIMGMLQSEKVSKIFNLMDKEISARLQKQYMTMKK